jgi:hypothetical protein
VRSSGCADYRARRGARYNRRDDCSTQCRAGAHRTAHRPGARLAQPTGRRRKRTRRTREPVSWRPYLYQHVRRRCHARRPIARWDIRTTFMQRLPGVDSRIIRSICQFIRWHLSRTDLSGYDLVLSNKSGFCHGVRTQRGHGRKAVHVCYCLTPTRFLWLFDQYREREQHRRRRPARLLQSRCWRWLRRWDLRRGAARRSLHRHQQRGAAAASATIYHREERRSSTRPWTPSYFTPEPAAARRGRLLLDRRAG